ncbi:superoxide dismutase [Cu-Zn]-like [Microplitis mediator]|uniref:superoxide dismutase [Cu-Zn]-like n=1 Tax=Microplitis mediator TaxID=375433 RepID=UPI0025544814|nr:superoxide dismutase [Cu-Zn]-like [Microplitis mediator]XP_057331518.1 superoxide dismutase [Cu-Zn]-like [Microplitis mediator]
MKSIILLLVFAAVAVSEDTIAIVKFLEEHPNNIAVNIRFVQSDSGGPVTITGTITGLTPGKHGFHIYDLGNFYNNCTNIGGHFNPTNHVHGAPTDTIRHVGDLGNIEANADGVAVINIVDNVISLDGLNSILGHGAVILSGVDDLGNGGNEQSLINGNAGTPVSCGFVGLL